MAEPAKHDRQKGAIRYALAALKNVGPSAVETIVAARDEGGPFKSLADFASRLNAKAVNKRAIEMLAQSGGLDALEPDRATVCANADMILAAAQRRDADAAAGTNDLFGLGEAEPSLALRRSKAWTPLERLENEFASIGFYLSGHPLDQYAKVLEKLGVRRYAEFEAATAKGATSARLAAIVVSARERRSAKGNKFAFAMFSDASGQFEAVVFSDTLAAARDLLQSGTPVLVTVEAERDGDTVKLRAQSIEGLDAATAAIERGLLLRFSASYNGNAEATFAELKETLKQPAAGARGGRVCLIVPVPDRARELQVDLPGKYDVSPAQAGILATVRGIEQVQEI